MCSSDLSFGIPPKEDTNPRSIARRAVFEEFQRRNPSIRVVNAGGLELTGSNFDSGFLMAMAGDNPPDIFYVNFRQYYNFIDQGFCRPLDDLVALTKADQPTAAELAATTSKVAAELAKHPAAHPDIVVTSAETGAGMPELRARLAKLAVPRPSR